MLLMVRAVPKAAAWFDWVSVVYLLEGWSCYGFSNLEFYNTDVRQVRVTSVYANGGKDLITSSWILSKQYTY